MNDILKLNGEVRFGRVFRNRNNEYVMEMELRDDASHARFLTMAVSMEDFAKMVTGLNVPCEMEVGNLDRIGKTREHKQIQVLVKGSTYESTEDRKRNFQIACAPYEVDGWEAGIASAMGTKTGEHTPDGYYVNVSFVRFVDAVVNQNN